MEQQEKQKETKEKDKIRREKLAGYFFDLSKLCFAGLVIGVITDLFPNLQDAGNWYVITIGLILTIISALLANKILR